MQTKIDNPVTAPEKPIASATNRARSIRMPFVPAGAVTGVGSLPLMSAAAAIQAVADQITANTATLAAAVAANTPAPPAPAPTPTP